MSYVTKQQMIDRFGEDELVQLTDQLDQGAIDDVRLTIALTDADTEIDSYLAPRYTLPLASVPPVLVRIAADIARYYLYGDRASERVAKRYGDAVAWLKSLARGEASLGLDAAGDEAASESGTIDYETTADDRVFTKDTLADF